MFSFCIRDAPAVLLSTLHLKGARGGQMVGWGQPRLGEYTSCTQDPRDRRRTPLAPHLGQNSVSSGVNWEHLHRRWNTSLFNWARHVIQCTDVLWIIKGSAMGLETSWNVFSASYSSTFHKSVRPHGLEDSNNCPFSVRMVEHRIWHKYCISSSTSLDLMLCQNIAF